MVLNGFRIGWLWVALDGVLHNILVPGGGGYRARRQISKVVYETPKAAARPSFAFVGVDILGGIIA